MGATLVAYTLTDPILVEGLLLHASVHLDAVNRRPWTVTTLHHQRQLICMISQRLANTMDTHSDALIFGVAMIAACGVSIQLIHFTALCEQVYHVLTRLDMSRISPAM